MYMLDFWPDNTKPLLPEKRVDTELHVVISSGFIFTEKVPTLEQMVTHVDTNMTWNKMMVIITFLSLSITED